MLNFLGQNQLKASPGWSPVGERTVIPNVVCMLPPDLKQDTVHYLLLRSRLEEVEYYLRNLTDETKYVQYYDSDNSDSLESKSKYPPDVKIRFRLIQERSKIIESILQVYPPFIYRNEEYLPNIEYCQEVREIYLNSNDQISIIIGSDNENIKKMEQQFNVKISLLEIPLSLKSSPDSIYKDCLCKLLIKGNSKDQITECFQYIQNILKSKDSYDFLLSQKKKVSENTSSNAPIPPWEVDKLQAGQADEEEEHETNDLYGLDSLLKDKHHGYLSLLQKQNPPGS